MALIVLEPNSMLREAITDGSLSYRHSPADASFAIIHHPSSITHRPIIPSSHHFGIYSGLDRSSTATSLGVCPVCIIHGGSCLHAHRFMLIPLSTAHFSHALVRLRGMNGLMALGPTPPVHRCPSAE